MKHEACQILLLPWQRRPHFTNHATIRLTFISSLFPSLAARMDAFNTNSVMINTELIE
jgi:hypothetical protein